MMTFKRRIIIFKGRITVFTVNDVHYVNDAHYVNDVHYEQTLRDQAHTLIGKEPRGAIYNEHTQARRLWLCITGHGNNKSQAISDI